MALDLVKEVSRGIEKRRDSSSDGGWSRLPDGSRAPERPAKQLRRLCSLLLLAPALIDYPTVRKLAQYRRGAFLHMWGHVRQQGF